MTHRKGMAWQIPWWLSLIIIAFIIVIAVIASSAGENSNRGAYREERRGVEAPELEPELKRIMLELKPGEWSKWVKLPLFCDWRYDCVTPNGEYEIQYSDDKKILKRKMGKYHYDGARSGDPRFRSEKGGKVLITTKGGLDFGSVFGK